MKQKTNILAQFKQWILSIVITRFFYENSNHSFNLELWMYKIKRRKPLQDAKKRSKYQDVSIISYRFSKLKGYKYMTISFFYYIQITIDFHRPL